MTNTTTDDVVVDAHVDEVSVPAAEAHVPEGELKLHRLLREVRERRGLYGDRLTAEPPDWMIVDDVEEEVVEVEPTDEELEAARIAAERQRAFEAGEWTEVYGVDLSQIAATNVDAAPIPDLDPNSFMAQRLAKVSAEVTDTAAWEHEGGVPWYAAPLPRKVHRCKAHSTKKTGDGFQTIERCRCGGTRLTDMDAKGEWEDRNSRVEDFEAGKAAEESLHRDG